jgi:hypothetical protein
MQKRLASSKVDLPHSSFFQQPKASLCLRQLLFVRGRGGMEAETASFIALACEMIIDRYWALARTRSEPLLSRVEENKPNDQA